MDNENLKLDFNSIAGPMPRKCHLTDNLFLFQKKSFVLNLLISLGYFDFRGICITSKDIWFQSDQLAAERRNVRTAHSVNLHPAIGGAENSY